MILGLIILVRPVNALVLFSLPFLSQDSLSLAHGIKSYLTRWKLFLISVILILTIFSIQFIIYKIQTGSFFVYSYGSESFNFTKPHMIDFLFSYKKGFFLYTPVCLVALAGFVFLFRNRFMFFCLLFFLGITVYVLSSWRNWYYGGSFSSRVMVEYIPYFALLLGFLAGGISKRGKRMVLPILLTMLILLNQLQTMQYRYNIIHWSDMNKERYWKVFLDLRPVFERRHEANKSAPALK